MTKKAKQLCTSKEQITALTLLEQDLNILIFHLYTFSPRFFAVLFVPKQRNTNNVTPFESGLILMQSGRIRSSSLIIMFTSEIRQLFPSALKSLADMLEAIAKKKGVDTTQMSPKKILLSDLDAVD